MPVRNTPLPTLAPILQVAGLRAVEARHSNDGLMARAGAAAAAVARAMVADRAGGVVVLAGPGNNGGDAFVVARLLTQDYFDVVTVFRGNAEKLPLDAAAAHAALIAADQHCRADPPAGTPALIVDGLFGIGQSRPPAPPYAGLIDWANASGAPILALDVPSGIDADTGAAFAPAIAATATVTFIAQKPGLLTGAGLDCAGDVTLHTLDVRLAADDDAGELLRWDALARVLPDVLNRRRRNVHKGTFGTLAIIGGAHGMMGAPILSARAALKTGAGKVWVGFAATPPAVDWGTPELMLRDAEAVLAAGADVVVAGPGLGTTAAAKALVAGAIALAVPLVLDADALNLVAHEPALRAALRARHAPTLLTPHPAEAARLLGVDAARIAADRVGAARTLARELDAHVVLKGAGSVLARPDGRFDINGTGGPALATAGSGDVLAGMTGALLAQGLAPADALRVAVCLHGAAADALVAAGIGPLGLTASELADAARSLVNAAARAAGT